MQNAIRSPRPRQGHAGEQSELHQHTTSGECAKHGADRIHHVSQTEDHKPFATASDPLVGMPFDSCVWKIGTPAPALLC